MPLRNNVAAAWPEVFHAGTSEVVIKGENCDTRWVRPSPIPRTSAYRTPPPAVY